MLHVSTFLKNLYLSAMTIGGLLWAMNIPAKLGFNIVTAEWLGPYLGITIAAALLTHGRTEDGKSVHGVPLWLDLVLGFAAIGCWFWMAVHFQAWLFDFAGVTEAKYIPGLIAIATMLLALQRVCGWPISILVLVMIAYGLFGHVLPGAFSADDVGLKTLTMYLYADSSGIPGMVLAIVASLVLAFIIFGKMMEVSGATNFFTDVSLALMGHRRGGPAKVATIASGLFGSVSGSPVSNILSTGVVTIPLMTKVGFRPAQAAAIEATASTGGQLAPPVMGAAAFLMAEFLQIDYADIAMAAILPAILYYLCLIAQIDGTAARMNLKGMDKDSLPRLGAVLRGGYAFILPLGVLVGLLFGTNMQASEAALISSVVLLVFAMLNGRFRSFRALCTFVVEAGGVMISIVMIAAAAGVVVGIMNISGLGQSVTVVLKHAASEWGLFVMLVLTAILCIILGMGMPVTAIYIILASILGPSLAAMGIDQVSAHLFFFYFGVLSFLTPPVCVASFVAASLAKADMWETGWTAMRFAAISFVLPFLWVYNPALILHGTPLEIVNVVATVLAGIFLLAECNAFQLPEGMRRIGATIAYYIVVVAVMTSSVWLGSDALVLVPASVAVVVGARLLRRRLEGGRTALQG